MVRSESRFFRTQYAFKTLKSLSENNIRFVHNRAPLRLFFFYFTSFFVLIRITLKEKTHTHTPFHAFHAVFVAAAVQRDGARTATRFDRVQRETGQGGQLQVLFHKISFDGRFDFDVPHGHFRQRFQNGLVHFLHHPHRDVPLQERA